MPSTMREIMNPCLPSSGLPEFPNAPIDWNEDYAKTLARKAELELNTDHWEAMRALQGYFIKHERLNARELLDALDEKFHSKGGLKYLYELFPGGPIVQGCQLAGIEISPTLTDLS